MMAMRQVLTSNTYTIGAQVTIPYGANPPQVTSLVELENMDTHYRMIGRVTEINLETCHYTIEIVAVGR